MGTDTGEKFASLIESLQNRGPEFNYFYAIFLAEKITNIVHPERDNEKLEQKGLQFRPYELYVFPPKDIRTIEFKNKVFYFVINFMGLYGINSPLPMCYHHQVALQQKMFSSGKVPLQNFYDIFNSRFYWLYYQAWKKYRFYLQLSDNLENKTVQRVFTFIGEGPVHKKKQTSLNLFKLLQCSGLLSNRVRNKAGLRILLSEFLPKFPFEIIENVPNMARLSERTRLGTQYGDQAMQLGVNSVIGESMLDCMSRIRIEIGPIDYEDYLEFLPQGKYAAQLKDLLNLYLSDGLEYDIKLKIFSAGIGKIPWHDQRLKLGSTIWLGKPKEEGVEINYKYEVYRC